MRSDLDSSMSFGGRPVCQAQKPHSLVPMERQKAAVTGSTLACKQPLAFSAAMSRKVFHVSCNLSVGWISSQPMYHEPSQEEAVRPAHTLHLYSVGLLGQTPLLNRGPLKHHTEHEGSAAGVRSKPDFVTPPPRPPFSQLGSVSSLGG